MRERACVPEGPQPVMNKRKSHKLAKINQQPEPESKQQNNPQPGPSREKKLMNFDSDASIFFPLKFKALIVTR